MLILGFLAALSIDSTRYVGTGSFLLDDTRTNFDSGYFGIYDLQGGFALDSTTYPGFLVVSRAALTGDCTAATGSNVLSCAGIATNAAGVGAVSGSVASLSSTVSTQGSTIASLSSSVATLQGQVGQAPVGATGGQVAASGVVGEYRESCTSQAGAVTLSGTAAVIASLSLTTGDWLVSATPSLTGALVGTAFSAAINTTTTMLTQVAAGGADRVEQPLVSNAGADVGLNISNRHKTFSSTTTYNLLGTVAITLGTAKGYGCISALRIH